MHELFEKPAPLARGSTLSEQVTDALRRQVLTGEWPVGATLPSEAALAQELGVSRTVIRESVSRLKAEGLLDSRQGRGAFVASDRPRMGFAIADRDLGDLESLVRILELRGGIEIEAAAIAAARAEEADLAAMRTANESFGTSGAAGEAGVRQGVEADLAFHRAVATATQNEYFVNLYGYLSSMLRETIEAGRHQAIGRGGDSSAAVAEHEAVIAAIATGEPISARIAMRAHLEKSRDRLLQQLWVAGGGGA